MSRTEKAFPMRDEASLKHLQEHGKEVQLLCFQALGILCLLLLWAPALCAGYQNENHLFVCWYEDGWASGLAVLSLTRYQMEPTVINDLRRDGVGWRSTAFSHAQPPPAEPRKIRMSKSLTLHKCYRRPSGSDKANRESRGQLYGNAL